jgi:transposase-like protein
MPFSKRQGKAMCNLTNPAFTDEDKARELLEASRWPDGPVCPFCGQLDTVKPVNGDSMGSGWYYCTECQDKFTVRVGTLYERSHIPLHKWLLATHLVTSSKKGMSSLQISRMLGITYKSAWFMVHRIREGMTPTKRDPIGGQGRTVESDETVIGGKTTNRAYAKKDPKKQTVLTLVDRDGESRSFHIANVKAKTLREAIVKTVDRKSHFVTDELSSYVKIGREFAGHSTVNHSANEYVRLGGFAHVNTAEARFSLMKRAVFGTHHSVSEAHLSRYLTEWDFKWNTRRMKDGKRAAVALKGIEGKRLTYRIPNKTTDA